MARELETLLLAREGEEDRIPDRNRFTLCVAETLATIEPTPMVPRFTVNHRYCFHAIAFRMIYLDPSFRGEIGLTLFSSFSPFEPKPYQLRRDIDIYMYYICREDDILQLKKL